MDIAAVAMGVNLIEKTITLDRTTPSVEHVFSLEPNEMANFIHRVRNVEIALGRDIRELTEVQIMDRKLIRRSPYTKSKYPVGTKIHNMDVEFRRPGVGISPDKWENLVKTELTLNKITEEGQCLHEEMFS